MRYLISLLFLIPSLTPRMGVTASQSPTQQAPQPTPQTGQPPKQESKQPIPSAGKSKSNPPAKKPDQNTEAPKPNAAPAEQPVTKPEAPKSESVPANTSEKPKEKTSSDWWIVYLTGALVFVGVCQLIGMGVQTYWMQRTVAVAQASAGAAKDSADAATKTVNAMEATAERQLRAYVFPVSAQRIRQTPRSPFFMIEVTIKNSGQTPAYDYVSWLGVGVAVYPQPPTFPAGDLARGKTIILPGESVQFFRVMDDIEPNELAEIQNGTKGIYIFGEISYRDAFDKKRMAKYRMVCTGESIITGRFAPCDDGNEAD